MTIWQPFELELQSDDSAFLLDFITDDEMSIALIEGTPIVENEIYTGETVITPKVTQQVLQTSSKIVATDIVVKEIPYRTVPNEFGGMTAIIG